MMLTGTAAKVAKKVIQIPAIAARVNEWSRSRWGDTVFRLYQEKGKTRVELNPLYRLTGWGWVPSWRYLPGVPTFWVERWEGDFDLSGEPALTLVGSRRFGAISADDFDVDP
jgi:hypothetical protein